MVEKMKFINITGPRADIDRVVEVYLAKYEIHLENALSELSNARDLRPFVEINPYKEVLSHAETMIQKIHLDSNAPLDVMGIEDAVSIINESYSALEELNAEKKKLKTKRNNLRDRLQEIQPFRMLNYDLGKLKDFKFIRYHFGRISHEYFDKFSKYIYDNLNTVFYECYSDKDFTWGIYFVPAPNQVQVDALYSSLHFEEIILSNDYEGSPQEICEDIQTQLSEVEGQMKELYSQIEATLQKNAISISSAYQELSVFSRNFDIRKMAALTQERGTSDVYYILCGWMSNKDTEQFITESKNDKNITIIADLVSDSDATIKPPTKLKNPKLLKPFELFVSMYGLPAYNELDPTFFVAITYSFIFGAMFGDVGQGLCLLIGGYVLYRIKNMNLAAIVSLAGIFSTIFGFLYGSFFGFEDVIPTYWMKPMDNVMSALIIAVGLGVFLILVAIVLNIINSIRCHDMERLFFDPNGLTGLIFYGCTVACVIAMVNGFALPATIILVLLLGIPVLAMFLKEPLTNMIEKKNKLITGSIGMFIVEALVELFDILLTYATNTISFLRVGAFALSHAGMMMVVLSLAGAESGNPNWLIIILGNLLVAGMEGLIVGIQVLRLEYYEMFGRFYRGTGKEFKSFNRK